MAMDAGTAQRLVEAAREILKYVNDPDDVPGGMQTLEYRPPKSPAAQARETADRLEAQSRAVRRLRIALEEWPALPVQPRLS